jgi:ABC-type branched-subunit amino acid transport system permease subunit
MDMVFTVTPNGVVEWCSPSVASVLDRRPEDLVGGLSMVVIMLYRPSGLWPARQHGTAAEDEDKASSEATPAATGGGRP